MMFSRISISVLAVAVALAAACGDSKEEAAERRIEKQIEAQTGGQVKVDLAKGEQHIKTANGEMHVKDGQISIQGADGQSMVYSQAGNVPIPDGFPKEVPVYEGALVNQAMKEQNGFVLTLSTKDGMKKVVDSYRTKLTAQGWKESATSEVAGENIVLTFDKEPLNVIVAVQKDAEQTRIILMVEKADTEGAAPEGTSTEEPAPEEPAEP